MPLPTVSSCCCGCSLYFGTMFIGIYGAIATFASLVASSIVASQVEAVMENVASLMISYNGKDETKNAAMDAEQEAAMNLTISVIRTLEIVTAVVSFILFVIYLCLIYGAVKKTSAFMLPWLYVISLVIVINTLVMGGFTIFFMATTSVGLGFALAVVMIIALAVEVYCLIVVYSYYKKIEWQEEAKV